eukprot:scaffold87284_cov67-Phaeocystis_antarctica.AAC.11
MLALVIFTAGSSVMVTTKSSTTKSSSTSRRERAVRRDKRRRGAPKLSDTTCSGKPSMLATRRRTAVSLNACTSATLTWSGSSSNVWLIACSTISVTVLVCRPSGITIGMLPGTSFTWSARRPGQKPQGGQGVVADATQSTASPERAAFAWHCGRCLSGAHETCRALEARGLATHVHEAAGRARQTGAHSLRARNSAWAARRLLRAARGRKVAHACFSALTGAGEVGGAGVRPFLARQRRAGTLGAERANEPGSQATHTCLPSSAWYLPASHLTHVAMLTFGATVPGLHAVCMVLPVGA